MITHFDSTGSEIQAFHVEAIKYPDHTNVLIKDMGSKTMMT
jgi:hypothetical protein